MAIEIRDFSSIICGFTIKVKVTKGEMFVLLKFDQAVSTRYATVIYLLVRSVLGISLAPKSQSFLNDSYIKLAKDITKSKYELDSSEPEHFKIKLK